MPLNDEQARDERLILRDRGVGRDIGRNPLFDPDRPRTRTENRRAATDTLHAVGGFGQRTESVTSYSATPVAFQLVPGRQDIVNGAGAFHGITAYYDETSTNPSPTSIQLLVTSGNVPLGSLSLSAGIPASLVLPMGVNINSLTVETVISGTPAFNRSNCAVWVATVE